MKIERFRAIKSRLVEIYNIINAVNNEEMNLTEDEEKKIEEEIDSIANEIHNSDLSNIPFEEYEGFYDLGFNFNGTHANIDFNIWKPLGDFGRIRLKGCNLRNFDLSKIKPSMIDDDSFDEEIIRGNPEYFCPAKITDKDARQRYYYRSLTLSDLKKYNLIDIPADRFEYITKMIIDKIGINNSLLINPEVIDLFSYNFASDIKSSQLSINSTKDQITEYTNDWIKDYLQSMNHYEYAKIANSEYIKKNFPEYIIDFPEDKKELESRFLMKELRESDLRDNIELFKGKKFIKRINYLRDKEQDENLSEERIIYLLEKFPDISRLAIGSKQVFYELVSLLDTEKSSEENKSNLISYILEQKSQINNNDYLDTREIVINSLFQSEASYEELMENSSLYDKYSAQELIHAPDFERLENNTDIDIRQDIADGKDSIIRFFNTYGISTILDFEEDNGNIFTKNNGEILQFIDDAYFHYGINNHSLKTSLFTIKNDYNTKYYTKEQFEEFVRRMIVYGPSTGSQKFDYRNINGSFRNKYPELFLPQDAPKELQDKFYTGVISIQDLVEHPEYAKYFDKADLGISLERLPFTIGYEEGEEWNFIKSKTKSNQEAIRFLINNGEILLYYKNKLPYEALKIDRDYSLEELTEGLEKSIEEKIVSGEISFNESAPEFIKQRHPELFLDKNAPQALKDLYYTEPRDNENKLTKDLVEDLDKVTDWQKFLLNKDRTLVENTLKNYITQANNESVKKTFVFFLNNDPKIAENLISSMSAEQIISTGVILPEETIKKLINNNPEATLKALLFSNKIDRDKVLALEKYKELNNQNNTIDSVLSKLFVTKGTTDYEIFNHQIDEIYNLFTYDNVPEFIKTYKLFELGNNEKVTNDRILTYKGLDNDSRNRIILTDLFRISLDSNNKSLRDFAEIMKFGDEISKKVYKDNKLDLSNLSDEENAVFRQYVDTLVAINNIACKFNKEQKIINSTHNVSNDYQALLEQFKHNGTPIESSEVLNNLFGDEIKSKLTPESIIQYMDRKKELSTLRRMQNAQNLANGNLHLEKGDFIKGIINFDSYLRSMLGIGLKGGEFNRENSHSDATPLDLDFGCISEPNLQGGNKSDYDVISTTISSGYGNTWIVLKQYGKHFQDNDDNKIIEFLRLPEFYTYHTDDESTTLNNDRYVRTGIGVEDIDYIVSNEWKPSFGYEMAMAGIYIPVIDKEGKLVFSEEQYTKIREEMKGLSYYHAEPFEISPKARQIDALFEYYKKIGGNEEKIDSVKEVLSGKEDDVTAAKKKSTIDYLKGFFKSKGITVTSDLSSNLSQNEVELIDTGSTGRGTNVPGDGDFDFMLRHNLPSEVLSELNGYVAKLPKTEKIDVTDGFRIKGVTLPDGQNVDIDVTYARKDLNLEYSSDMAVKDRLNSIKQQSIEDYHYVKANIIMAKNILKQLGIYKKRGSDGATEHGGFGGIGVENWILQNGGSFATAIDTFLAATKDENGKDLTYSEFIEKYPIYDFGNNHREGRNLNDRFSSFLGSQGDNDGHEKQFEYVKEKFKELQKELQKSEISKDELVADEQQDNQSTLRQSISVQGLREASKSKFEMFCLQNFALMSKLLAKYISQDKTMDEGRKQSDSDSKKKDIGE